MRSILLILVFVCALHTECMSQQERQYNFTHYTRDNGLASYETLSMVQDAEGYIWIGTATGVQRFDGTRFIAFYHMEGDVFSIPENPILQLICDKKNNLWVLTASGHVGIFDTKNFRFKNVICKTVNSSADKKIYTDSRGNVFVLCLRSELLVYDEKNNSFSPADSLIPLPEKWQIISFCEEATSGKYYVGTDSGMVVYNPRTKRLSYKGHNAENESVINQMEDIRSVAPMLLDSKHRLWIMSWAPAESVPMFFCFDLYNKTTVLHKYRFEPLIKTDHWPRGMLEQKNGTVWVSGRNIFASYLEKENNFQLVHNGYVNDKSIYFDLVCDLREDREGNLWVATNNNGLYRFNPSIDYFLNVQHLNRSLNIRGEGDVLSFLPDKNGTLLTGTWTNGIYRYDASFKSIPVNIKGINEKETIIWVMHKSRDENTIWMGAQPGALYRYDTKTQQATYYDVPAIKHSVIRQILEDKKGNLWLGTQKGLFKCTNTSTGFDFDHNVEQIRVTGNNTIYALCLDSTGNLWVGTGKNGVYTIDAGNGYLINQFTTESPAHQRLFANFATSIYVYNDTTIIIGAEGISIYNTRTQRIRQVQLASNLTHIIASMQKDPNGDLWVSQSAGIFRFNPIKNNRVVEFNRKDGIENDRFREGASATLPDGRLVFGSSNQFIVFNPGKIDLRNSSSKITITGFKVNNQPLLVDSLLKLKYIDLSPDQDAITIDFSELKYVSASVIKYKLEGIDNDWVNADLSSQAIYPYLPPGTYTFMAKTEDSEGTPGKNTTIIILKVKPHFWQTWWFLGLIVFAALGIFLWVDKMRMQKIKATESVRSRIAQSLTEDMSNSLSSINITSELAKTKIETDTERTKEYINQISDASNRMIDAMYDMVWSINPENDTLQHTIDRMKTYAAEMESQYSPTIIFQVDEHAAALQLRMETRYEMLSVFKEAVNNAARHAHAKYIEVNIRYKTPSLTVCILDDGKGFDVELVELSRGLSEMRRRANTINAALLVKSEINTGTTVKLTINQWLPTFPSIS